MQAQESLQIGAFVEQVMPEAYLCKLAVSFQQSLVRRTLTLD